MDQAATGHPFVEFFQRTRDAWDAMYRDCERATTSIECEQYILMDDAAGRRFLSLFAQKAAEGVRIRLLLDGVGCRALQSNRFIRDIVAAGGTVRFFNRLRWKHLFVPSRWTPRSHVKTLLVDGRTAFTGSACVWEVMRNWHDLHLRFTGPAVEDVQRAFRRTWRSEAAEQDPALPASGRFSYVLSEPRLQLYPGRIYKELLEEVRGAQRNIRIVTPYFLPPRRLRRALRAAVRRGVTVEVLMSARTDVPIADHVSHSYFPGLLEQGLRIFLYPREVLHAKYVMIDDRWATVGSVNMDYLSLLRNREASLIIRDPATIAKLWEISEEYLRESRRVDMRYWKEMPFPYRIAGYLGRCMRQVL